MHSDPAPTWELIRDQFLANGDAGEVFRQRSRLVEQEVQRAFVAHLAPEVPTGLAVLAVGGYGRQELFPYSDVDVCLLVDNDKLAEEKRGNISSFLQALWDANLRVSQSVRTVPECCELHDTNIELNVSLIDQRFLAGDAGLYSRLEPKLKKFFENQRVSLARHLCRLARSRHAQYQNTVFHLEPNIKEGPGGLRDVHLLEWFHKLDITGLHDISWRDVDEPRHFLAQVRCFLHYRSRRDNNNLSFEAQDDLAEQKYSQLESADAWMREYFRHVRAIEGAASRAMDAIESKHNVLLAGFREWRSRLSNAEFTVSKDRVLLKSSQTLETDPSSVLRLFQFVARHGIALSLDCERRIMEAYPKLREFFANAGPIWPSVRELLLQPHAAMALRSMQDCGVLRLLFPEWEGIEHMVTRDFYHRYTVDEHTVVTIENLQKLARTTEPGHRRFSTLLTEIEDISVLRTALLLHDVGKGARTGNHSEESVRMARETLDRLGTPDKARDMILFLIDQHLALSAAMTGRDLDDPATARMLADKVGTIEGLRYLTLLTYADVAAVNPTALSPWRLEQLWRVYLCTHHELTRELQTDRIQLPLGEGGERESFLKGLPVRYLRTHSEPEIRMHLELEGRRKEAEVALDIRKTEGGYMLTVLAKDRLHLFASVAGALASFGMNILKAEAFANQQGTILDTFAFADPARTLELNPSEVDRLQSILERVLLGRLHVRELLRSRPKPSLPSKRVMITPKVSFNNEASETATLVELVAEDRPGLLYDVASALSNSGCNIELVLVDTEAHKAMDVFYISTAGKKLASDHMQRLKASLEAVCAG
ncbi:MAG: HD domain-containing protein [Acidobacteria bacterium]|nr:HD domain-containing protein [Acidobacteriota bacterium]